MTRGAAAVGTRVPIVGLMPAIYQEDPVARAFCAGLDDVLAPLISTLDCLDAYIDPDLTPDDFLEWLAGWVGTELVEDWPLDRKRVVVGSAVEQYRLRGTVDGLRRELEAFTGGVVEIEDSGGVTTSTTPGTRLIDGAGPFVRVRIVTDDGTVVQLSQIEEIVRASKPAHVTHAIELVAGGRAGC